MNNKNLNKATCRKKPVGSPIFTFITTFLIFTGLAMIGISFFTEEKPVKSKEKFAEYIDPKKLPKVEDNVPPKAPEENPILKDPKYISYQGNTQTYYNDYLRGFLTIDNYPKFKEPVYQTNNNTFFLNHAGNGEEHFKGVTFMDYRTRINSRKIIIFSHNAKSLNMPFSIIENYRQKEFFEAFPDISFEINNKTMTYRIFSIYVDTGDFDYMKMDFQTEGEYYQHLLIQKQKSMYNTGVGIKPKDAILVIQTCEEDQRWAKYNKKYLVLVAKRIK